MIIELSGFRAPALTNQHIPLVIAKDDTPTWNITIHIEEKSGISNTIMLGVAPDASDGLDQHYDLPEPPLPPQSPFLRAWFTTSFAIPFNSLLQEYKSSSSNRAVWNLSVLWLPQPGNQMITTIDISWNTDQIPTPGMHSLLLYENNTVVADMLTMSSYAFSTNGSLQRFQIISESELSNYTEEPFENTTLLLMIGAFIGIVIIIVVCIVIIRKKK
jgi:hypothetical protein